MAGIPDPETARQIFEFWIEGPSDAASQHLLGEVSSPDSRRVPLPRHRLPARRRLLLRQSR